VLLQVTLGVAFGNILYCGQRYIPCHGNGPSISLLRAIVAEHSDMAKNILLVDDEPNIVLSLEFLMKRAGYGVQTAADGDAALEAIREQPPDLILLDVNIPKRDGFDVCQTIRANPEWNDIPIIMLTAKGRDVEREKGLALGADDYVTKPFATQEVVDKVRAMLGDEK
jgi:DNA-binding response OmpR family regulator